MTRAKLILVIAVLSLSSHAAPPATRPAEPLTAVLGAFDEEVAVLEKALAGRRQRRILGVRFVTGRIKGRKVVLGLSGIGKVNAAMVTTLMVEHFRPRELIFSGVSGALSPKLRPGDIVIGRKIVQHDYGLLTDKGTTSSPTRNPINGKRNPVFFPADAGLLKLAQAAGGRIKPEKITTTRGQRLPRIRTGVIATGDVFVASAANKARIHKRLKADVVEMEGGAVAQVCWQLKVPCIVIRSVSDLADAGASDDFKKFYKAAARNSAALVQDILTGLAKPEPEKAGRLREEAVGG